ncbi:MAG: phosphate signaling complex protein PhoU [Clostridia bacterium]|nr:phosphate signaling complex protein PhoU [Clostridia bacterium]
MPKRILMTAQLDVIHKSLAKMTALISKSLNNMIIALKEQDLLLADEVIEGDEQIDAMELKIEKDCILILARHQPIASDLRDVTSVFRVISDLERIGDQCADICEYIKLISQEEYVKPLVDIPQMAIECEKMINMAIRSFISKDLELAKEVLMMDNTIDDYFENIREELIEIMSKKPETVRQCTYLILIVKYLEKIADHATNISGWLIYNITGTH